MQQMNIDSVNLFVGVCALKMFLLECIYALNKFFDGIAKLKKLSLEMVFFKLIFMELQQPLMCFFTNFLGVWLDEI